MTVLPWWRKAEGRPKGHSVLRQAAKTVASQPRRPQETMVCATADEWCTPYCGEPQERLLRNHERPQETMVCATAGQAYSTEFCAGSEDSNC